MHHLTPPHHHLKKGLKNLLLYYFRPYHGNSKNHLRWIPVESYIYYRDALLASKCRKNVLCSRLFVIPIFKTRREVSCRETRNISKLNVPFFKTAAGKRIFPEELPLSGITLMG